MKRRNTVIGVAVAIAVLMLATAVSAQSSRRDYDDYADVKVDRYLDAEVWTNYYDEDYYIGDNIVINFRTSRDAFVAIYSIDTRGQVNLLFPTDPQEDNFVYGGVTNSIPGDRDDYDLVVTGPEGFETIQIIASRERFPIPNWYGNSGLVCEWDDRAEYMDFLNNEYFVRYGGQRFAFDRAVFYVDEWEPDYYRPVYTPYYPSWTVCGNVYIDYPYGATVYINGHYWGIAPLYIPRIAIGWHTITVYDYYGHCWESDFHCSRYNTVVFNKTIVQPSPTVKSKYKEVRTVGYREPNKNGYPTFSKTRGGGAVSSTANKPSRGGKTNATTRSSDLALKKSYVRGSSQVVKTSRGWETTSSGLNDRSYNSSRSKTATGTSRTSKYDRSDSKSSTSGYKRTRTSGSSRESSYDRGKTSSGSSSSGTYRKRSATSSGTRSKVTKSTRSKSSGNSSVNKGKSSSGSTKGSAGSKSKSSGNRSSGASKSKSSKSSKSNNSSSSKKKR